MHRYSTSTYFQLLDQDLRLYPHKALFWEQEELLLIADLHFGKVTHFRKSGIPVPRVASEKNWAKMNYLIVDCQPKRVIFLGDLFHSDHNEEWEQFGRLIERFSEISFELVIGNHDILDQRHYSKYHIKIHNPELNMPPFLFTHIPLEDYQGKAYNIAGHIHPAVKFRGEARQGLKVPCYYFGEHQGILPAFGSFTGFHAIRPGKTDAVFVLTEDKVIQVN